MDLGPLSPLAAAMHSSVFSVASAAPKTKSTKHADGKTVPSIHHVGDVYINIVLLSCWKLLYVDLSFFSNFRHTLSDVFCPPPSGIPVFSMV